MPEARIILAQTCVYLSLAKKNNSTYLAINKAIDFVKSKKDLQVPNKLKDSHYKDSNKLIKDKYLYPHDYKGYVKQDYLPDEYKSLKFYETKNIGYEKKLNENLKNLKEGLDK